MYFLGSGATGQQSYAARGTRSDAYSSMPDPLGLPFVLCYQVLEAAVRPNMWTGTASRIAMPLCASDYVVSRAHAMSALGCSILDRRFVEVVDH
jgi:hypothetical protein